MKPLDEEDLDLTGEGELPPAKLGNTKTPVEPKLAALWEAIEQLNTLFDENWGTGVDVKAFVEHVSGKVGEDAQISAQWAANSEEQFLASPNLKQAVIIGLVQSQENSGGMTNELFSDERSWRGSSRSSGGSSIDPRTGTPLRCSNLVGCAESCPGWGRTR